MFKYLLLSSLFFILSCRSENKSLCVLQATYDGSGSSSFIFRKDGSFQWTSGTGMGVFTTEGKYTYKDNIIELDKIGFDNVVKSKRLLIASKNPVSNSFGKYVLQVDQRNRLIDSMFVFTVYIDERHLLK